MKKIVNVSSILLLTVVMLLTACSTADKESTPTPSSNTNQQEANGPVTLSVFAPQSPGIEKLDVNPFSKHVEEKLNITFDWETAPNNVFAEKKMLLLSSGDYPALILGAALSKADQIKYGKQGVLVPLNDLIEQHAPNIKQAMEELPYLKSAMTAPDGNIYALPKVNECFHCTYGHRTWINTTWLDKLGLQMPTTTEEFHQVLQAFKEKDPNENGKADEIPLTTSYDTWGGGITPFLMNSFIYEDTDTRISLRDGKVILSAAQPEWKEGLAYLRQLYSEGLIDKAAFTQNNDAVRQLASKPEPLVGAVTYSVIGNMINASDASPRHKEYDVVPPLKGPGGVQLSFYSVGVGDGQFVITNKASEEEQIAAMKLADYLFSEEGTVMTTWGFENDGWKKAESGALDHNGQPAKYESIKRNAPEGSLDVTWWQLGTMKMTNALRESFAAPSDPLQEGATDYRLWQAAKKYEPYAKPELVYPRDVFFDPTDAAFIATIQKSLKDYIDTNTAQFITGNKDLDKDWDSYLKGFEGMRVNEYLDILQKSIDN